MSKNKLTEQQNFKSIFVPLPVDLHEKAKSLAKKTRRTSGAFLGLLLENAIKEFEIKFENSTDTVKI